MTGAERTAICETAAECLRTVLALAEIDGNGSVKAFPSGDAALLAASYATPAGLGPECVGQIPAQCFGGSVSARLRRLRDAAALIMVEMVRLKIWEEGNPHAR